MNTKKKHILFLPAWYPSEEDPMFGLFVQKYAEMLSNQYQISILYHNSKADKQKKLTIHIKQVKLVNLISIQYSGKNKFLRLIYFLIGMHKAYKLIKNRFGKADFSHVQILTRMGVIAWILKIFHGIPYFITEHWSRYLPEHKSYHGFLRKKITNFVVKKSVAISTVSYYLARYMQEEGIKHKNKYSILRNVVDEQVFILKNNISNRKEKRILHVSCFEELSKNLRGMLDALLILKEKRQDFKCIMAGIGDDYNMIVDYAKKIGVEDRVEFPGLLTEKEVAEQMTISDFYLQSSHYETLSVVISEALCCGLPVVSTDVGAISEIVNESNGILVKSGDTKELAHAIDLMLDTHQKYSSKEIRDKAVGEFSKNAVLEQFTRFYAQINENESGK